MSLNKSFVTSPSHIKGDLVSPLQKQQNPKKQEDKPDSKETAKKLNPKNPKDKPESNPEPENPKNPKKNPEVSDGGCTVALALIPCPRGVGSRFRKYQRRR